MITTGEGPGSRSIVRLAAEEEIRDEAIADVFELFDSGAREIIELLRVARLVFAKGPLQVGIRPMAAIPRLEEPLQLLPVDAGRIEMLNIRAATFFPEIPSSE